MTDAPLRAPMRVRSALKDYQVESYADTASVARALVAARQVAVMDRRVAALHPDFANAVQQGVPTLLIDATEENKTLDGVVRVVNWFQAQGASRKTTLVAIGGGIVQDIAALAAGIFHRGMPWILVPTTLLAMCDSCIGAKSGVNHNGIKNQLGLFNAPGRVLLTTDFLRTLDAREVASGLGEILKLAITGSEGHFAALEAWFGARAPASLDGLDGLIFSSLEVKRAVIEEDEFEADRRRILNYGHTFGHALESHTRYAVPHGLAVAWGVDLVNHIAHRRGLLGADWEHRIRALVRSHLAHNDPTPVTAKELIAHARHDKKASSATVHLSLLEGAPGRLTMVPVAFDAKLEADLDDFLAIA